MRELRRAHRRARACFRDREEAAAHLACASYPAVLKADVLAAGKGVIIAADEREARAALDVFFAERRFGDDRGRARGVPRGRGAVAARALRRRAGAAARAGAGLQAHLRRRRGPEHRRHGQLLAGAGHRRASAPSEIAARGPPADRGRAAPARHALPRRPLRRPDDDRRRRRRCSSSTAASATRRRRRCCRACAPTCSSCSRPRPAPGGLAGVGARVVARLGRDRGARLARLPGVVVEGRRDHGLVERPSTAEVLHAGTARARRRARDRRRPRAERDRARRDAGRGARPRLRGRRADRASTASRCATRHRAARGGEGGAREWGPRSSIAPVDGDEVEHEFDELDVDAPQVGHRDGLEERHAGDGEGRRRSSRSAASATRCA